jgi:hypothetical protein
VENPTARGRRPRRVIASEKYFGGEAISPLLTKDAAVLLRECVDFLVPHLAAAKVTGEVCKHLDIQTGANGSHESCSRCSAHRRPHWTWTTPTWSPISCAHT